jgi:ribonuclease HII
MKWLNDLIEAWHKNPNEGGPPIWEAVGMSPELYARWVERPPRWVLGIDEVGYGALAGPLVIGGVIAPANWTHPLLKDSKKFTGNAEQAEVKRAAALMEVARADNREDPDVLYFLHRTPPDVVDRLGVYNARIRAFGEIASAVLKYVELGSCLVVIDGDVRAPGLEHVCLPKADSFVPQVSAASIVAKVARDTEMRGFDAVFPEYKFGKHKGYGSPEHQEAIVAHGLCPIHRKSYRMKFLEGARGSSPSLP